MTRWSACALIFATLLGASACADNILKERPAARVAARSAPAQARSVAGSVRGESSVCAAYRRQLRQTLLAQPLATGAARRDALRTRELTLNAVIADACE